MERNSTGSLWSEIAIKTRTESLSSINFPKSDQEGNGEGEEKRQRSLMEDLRLGKYDNWDPERCIRLLKNPTVQNYTGLRKLFSHCSSQWMVEFLEMNGLDVLLESLELLSEKGRRGQVKFADCLLQLECVDCVKSLMNSKQGLEYIIENPGYTRKLAKALDTRNTMVKKQVFELLSAICVYAEKGHSLALDALEAYKVSMNQRYRFSLIMQELKGAEVLPYTATLLGFINCIIIGTEKLEQRIRVRNEMIGLGLLEILDSLRWVEDDEVFIQCHVFDTSKHADDEHEESLGRKSTANHYDLFESVLEKVKDTPLAFSFLVLLQNLDRLDPKDNECDQAWAMLEEMSRKLAISPKPICQKSFSDASTQTTFENDIDAESVLSEDSGRPVSRSESMNSHASVENTMEPNSQNNIRLKKKTCLTLLKFFASPHLSHGSPEIAESYSSPLQSTAVSSDQTVSSIPSSQSLSTTPLGQTLPPPPPPPPPPSSSDVPLLPVSHLELGMAPPPPPPPPPLPPSLSDVPLLAVSRPELGTAPPPPPPPGFGTCPPPPPLPIDPGGIFSSTNRCTSGRPLPPYLQPGSYHTFPKPKQKMKTLNWSKIPVGLVSGQSIWSELCQDTENVQLNFEQVEELFCQKSAALNTAATPKGKLKREQSEVSLLDPKRSLNVNIFLKQFKGGGKELVELIRNCRSGDIGVERLRTLLKVLPECDEMSLIKDFSGDKTKLGTAEKFYSLLSEVKSYKVRVQGMIQVEELQPNVEVLCPQIQQYLETCEILLNSATLKQFLKLVLVTGNFINAGSYAGNALGFRLSTLPKLMETRANKPRMTLLHYLVDVAEKESKEMLNFTEELCYLPQCSRLTVDGLAGEVRQLVSGIEELEKQIDDSDANLRKFFGSFMKDAKIELGELEKGIEEIRRFSSRLAKHFCEDEQRFKTEECINSFHIFCEKIKIAKRENEERKRQEERAERLRKQREEEQTRKGHNLVLKEEETPTGEQKRRKGRRDSKNISPSLTGMARLKDFFRRGVHEVEIHLGVQKKSS